MSSKLNCYDESVLTSRTMGNDVSQSYDFNDWETAGGRLDTFTTGASIDPLLNFAYGYDEVGNITGLTYSSDNLTESRVYSYDELNRLRTVTIGGLVTESVGYDPDNGNIDYKDGVEYGYDSIQPHAVNKLDSVQKYTYDANGSMTSRTVDGTTYAMGYDSENRMTTITGGSLTARYVFDGDGRRVLSVVGDARTLYVNAYFEVEMVNNAKVDQDLTIEDVDICENRYCSFMPLAISDIEAIGMPSGNFGTRTFITEIMEPENANVTWRIYYPGGGLRVQTTSTENLSFVVQDHINSTAMTLNNSGAVTGEVIYSAWGEVRNLYGSTPTKKLFTGQYEAEAGLYFYNARWYDNQLGRFAQADIIIPELGNPLAWDRFTGMYDNPIRYSDPSGNITCDDNDGYGNCINYERKIYKAQTDLDVFVQPGQVNEIEMKIVGIWPFVDQVSPKEYDLLLNSNGNVDYLKLLKMFYLQQEALNKAAELFPEMALWNDRGDAFRHAYWSALMANEFDKNFALEFSTAHETSFSPYPNREEVFMDLNNNHVGLDIGVLIPKTSKVQLQKLILAALNEGRLYVWNGKNIYLSNLVPIN